jgi:hypothetical protein
MTTTHTPTRLTVRANGDANSYALLDDKGHWFMSMLVNGEQMEAKQEANLRRLAACWNACEGIPTEEIGKPTGFPNLFNAAREMIAERLEIIRNDKHGLYTQEDLESAEREQALIELEIAQVEAGWRPR